MQHPLKPGGKFFRYLNGADGFFWKGMATRTDLGAQPPDHPRLVLNGRYYGGRIVARRPLVDAVAAVPMIDAFDLTGEAARAWMPAFITEHHSYRAVKMWMGGYAMSFFGGHVATIDTDTDPEYHDVVDYPHKDVSFGPRVERFANFIYVGEYHALRRIYPIDRVVADPYNADYTQFTPSDEVVVAFPGYLVAAMQLHEGKLYIVLTDPYATINGYVYSWDGFQIQQEYALPVSGAGGAAIASFRDHLLVVVSGWANLLVKDASGTWTTATVGGFLPSAKSNSIAALRDVAYIMGSDDKIWGWNGSSLSEYHTITGAYTPQATCCAAFNGRLYYGWGDYVEDHGNTGDRIPYIGCYDPDTAGPGSPWKDDYKALGTQTWWGAIMAMAVYRQRLIATLGVDGGMHTDIMTHVVENNPYSEWYDVTMTQSCPGAMNVVSGTPMVIDSIKVL